MTASTFTPTSTPTSNPIESTDNAFSETERVPPAIRRVASRTGATDIKTDYTKPDMIGLRYDRDDVPAFGSIRQTELDGYHIVLVDFTPVSVWVTLEPEDV